MKIYNYSFLVAAALAVVLAACKDPEFGSLNTGNFTDTSGPLKSASDFPVGIAIDYTPFLTDDTYSQTVATEASSVTFGYQMKHGAIVSGSGSLDFTKADELYNAAVAKGLEVYGHTLVWHQNQNGDYLRGLAAAPVATGPDLLAAKNGNFETGTTNFPGWSRLVGGTAAATYAVETTDVNQGLRTFKVTVTTIGSNAYDVQALGPVWTAVIGKTYSIKFWAKSNSASGIKLRLVNQTSQYQQQDFNVVNSWAEYTWNYTAGETGPQLRLNFPAVGVYLVDNVRITEAAPPAPSGPALIAKIDDALKTFVQGMATHYAGKVHAWDVVNESLSDDGSIRTGASASAAKDVYYWAEILGKDYIKNAFTYANQADPTATLFINDYALESNTPKLDALIALVTELQGQNVPIHGIGTQMHINIGTSYAGIVSMFQKLAATGLKVRISELDVQLNPNNVSYFDILSTDPSTLAAQAQMYKFVIDSYIKYVPAEQRHGITIWGVTDPSSWIVVNQGKKDAPLLFDGDYSKKPAYAATFAALKGR